MNDYLQNFFETPSKKNYLLARYFILAENDYRRRSFELAELSQLDQQKRYRLVLDEVERMLPFWALSPRVHYLAAKAAQKLGDSEEFETSRYLMKACLEGLLSSGDGTEANPYQITYLSDEQDVLFARDLRLSSQRLAGTDEGFFDVIDCQDGAQLWFAVSDLMLPIKSPTIRHKLHEV